MLTNKTPFRTTREGVLFWDFQVSPAEPEQAFQHWQQHPGRRVAEPGIQREHSAQNRAPVGKALEAGTDVIISNAALGLTLQPAA
ncbi:MAG: hypothetical protein NTV46_09720 [Verrucomicrobia bacterium]|nr:hypothetical protein [Verrucomicrobiota bacterium]